MYNIAININSLNQLAQNESNSSQAELNTSCFQQILDEVFLDESELNLLNQLAQNESNSSQAELNTSCFQQILDEVFLDESELNLLKNEETQDFTGIDLKTKNDSNNEHDHHDENEMLFDNAEDFFTIVEGSKDNVLTNADLDNGLDNTKENGSDEDRLNPIMNGLDNSLNTKLFKSIKSGEEITDDVKYIQDENSITPLGSFSDEFKKAEMKTNLNNPDTETYQSPENNKNESDEVIEGEFLETNLSNNMELSLEEEMAKISENTTDRKEILKQLKAGIQNSSTPKHIQIILKPRNLGTLNLNIKFLNNAMNVNIYVENENVQKALLDSLTELEYLLDPDHALNIRNINIIRKEDEIMRENQELNNNLMFKQLLKNQKDLKIKPIFFYKGLNK